MLIVLTIILRFFIWFVCLISGLTLLGNLVYLKKMPKYLSIVSTILFGILFGYLIPSEAAYVIGYFIIIQIYLLSQSSWRFTALYKWIFYLSAAIGWVFEINLLSPFDSINNSKFIILTIACISGLMAISYSSQARQTGWAVGGLFKNKISSIVLIGGLYFIGSFVISFFVNPWWSAILVLFLGIIGCYSIFTIFKAYSQPLAVFLMAISLILIVAYIF